MRHVIAILALTAALTASGATLPTAPSATVLVGGSPVAEVVTSAGAYVAAVIGTEYEIRLTNPTSDRVGVALSVDGLNVLDGKAPDGLSFFSGDRLWILAPGETATIPGWQVSGATARRFTVSREADSYARKMGKATRLGVIRAVFVEERAAQNWIYVGADMQGTPAGHTLTSTLGQVSTSLGTAMGASTTHQVTEVEFERGPQLGAVELRYVTPAELQAVLRSPPVAPVGKWAPEPEKQARR